MRVSDARFVRTHPPTHLLPQVGPRPLVCSDIDLKMDAIAFKWNCCTVILVVFLRFGVIHKRVVCARSF